MNEGSPHGLSHADQRKRALIDAAAALVCTMLLWPFPIARAMLSPMTHVLLLLTTWVALNVLYHVVCARVWRRTAAMYLLGYALCDAESAPAECTSVDDRTAIRWGVLAGVLVVFLAFSARIVTLVRNASGAEPRRWTG